MSRGFSLKWHSQIIARTMTLGNANDILPYMNSNHFHHPKSCLCPRFNVMRRIAKSLRSRLHSCTVSVRGLTLVIKCLLPNKRFQPECNFFSSFSSTQSLKVYKINFFSIFFVHVLFRRLFESNWIVNSQTVELELTMMFVVVASNRFSRSFVFVHFISCFDTRRRKMENNVRCENHLSV